MVFFLSPALLLAHCAPRRLQPVLPAEPLTAARVVDYLRTRGVALETLEAKIEIESTGLTPPLPKLFGALRILRQGPDLHLQVQAYLPLGAPAFELLAQGENFQLFVPGEGRCYTNSVGLLFGNLPRPGAEYQLLRQADQAAGLVLEESIQGARTRRIFLRPSDFSFLRLEAGEAQVDLETRAHPRREAFAWLPRRLTFRREGLTFQLALSQVQVNALRQPAIQFRDPGRLNLYLVEPPPPAPAPASN